MQVYVASVLPCPFGTGVLNPVHPVLRVMDKDPSDYGVPMPPSAWKQLVTYIPFRNGDTTEGRAANNRSISY